VDGNGLLPLRAGDRTWSAAQHFRRFLQNELPRHVAQFPAEDPLAAAAGLPRAAVPPEVAARWPAAHPDLLDGRAGLASIAVDHSVLPAPFRGGEREAARVLARFVAERLSRYEEDRNHPDRDAASGLSPYLHFGHAGAHQVFAAVAAAEDWRAPEVPPKATGSRAGWWGMRPAAEAFLDQLVTWRELGYSTALRSPDHDRYDGVPEWARRTLDRHRGDPRPQVYDADAFEHAATHDELWNAAQRQLVREGRLPNYVRMLWGKKVLEWSASPEEAFATLVRLNDRYAVDGRDPNSYSGIAWCFGRYDRPWGPERPVLGTVRAMSTAAARRKLELDAWLRRHGEEG
jgi:deoxyribodipyrimidine photo-lyase